MNTLEFINILDRPIFKDVLRDATRVAVGVSGGPDSMALALLLAEWTASHGMELHALTVDHRLRAESAMEAQQVAAWLSGYAHVRHSVLVWNNDKSDGGLQQQARQARYELMADYCADAGIEHLFAAHHQDDQYETVLFRLAKGSGLTGLGGIRPVYAYSRNLQIVRPLLETPKAALVTYCDERGQGYFADPGNEANYFARGRLRQSAAALEAEGFSGKRVSITAARLRRADEALHLIAENSFLTICKEIKKDCFVFDFKAWCAQPEEIGLRQILMVFSRFYPDENYYPRMEKVEALVADLRDVDVPFRKRSLGGGIFERNEKRGEIVVTREETLVSCGKEP